MGGKEGKERFAGCGYAALEDLLMILPLKLSSSPHSLSGPQVRWEWTGSCSSYHFDIYQGYFKQRKISPDTSLRSFNWRCQGLNLEPSDKKMYVLLWNHCHHSSLEMLHVFGVKTGLNVAIRKTKIPFLSVNVKKGPSILPWYSFLM